MRCASVSFNAFYCVTSYWLVLQDGSDIKLDCYRLGLWLGLGLDWGTSNFEHIGAYLSQVGPEVLSCP